MDRRVGRSRETIREVVLALEAALSLAGFASYNPDIRNPIALSEDLHP